MWLPTSLLSMVEISSNRGRRALTLRLLWSGTPSVVFLEADLLESVFAQSLSIEAGRLTAVTKAIDANIRVFGYRGFDFIAWIDFAVQAFHRLSKECVARYKEAIKSKDRQAALIARDTFLQFLEVVTFLQQENVKSVLLQDKKNTALLKNLPTYEIGFSNFLAQTYHLLNDFSAAAEVLAGSVQKQRSLGADKGLPGLLLNLGNTYDNAKEPGLAAAAFQECIDVAGAIANTLAAADCHTRMADLQRSRFNYPGAIASYRAAIAGYEGHPQEAKPWRHLGFLYESSMNDYAKALEHFQKALVVATKHSLKDLIPGLHVDMARVYRNRGDYERALEEVEQALAVLGEESRERGAAELEQARIYWYRGDYRRALSKQRHSLQLAIATGDTYLEIQTRSLAGLIALNRGDLPAAQRALRDALHMSRATGRPSEEAAQLNNLGLVVQESQNYDEAIVLYRKALKIDDALGSIEGRSYDLRALAIALNLQGQNQEALEAVEAALTLSREIGNRYNEMRSLYVRGQILGALGKAEASASYSLAAKLAAEASVPEVEWRAFYALARLDLAGNDLAGARTNFGNALAIALRLGRESRESTSAFSRADLFGDAIVMEAGQKNIAEVFALLERAKARELLDILSADEIHFADPVVDNNLRELLRLQNEIWRSESGASAKIADVSRLINAYTRLHNDLETRAPKALRAMSIAPVSLNEFAEVLPQGTLVLNYYLQGTRPTVLAVTRDTAQVFLLDVSAAALSADISALKTALGAFSPVDELLQRLATGLLQPVLPLLTQAQRLVVIPHGSLNYVPFAALPLGKGRLIDTMTLSEAPTASMLFDQLHGGPAPRPQRIAALAPANDLPFAYLEAQAVGDRQAYLGVQATKEQLRRLQVDAVDLATHTRLLVDTPLDSSIELAAGQTDDGRLRLREVFSLANVPGVVSLSACQSVGAATHGNEWLGFGSAFLTAGARSVVVSKHRVSDLASAVLMKRFHRLLKEYNADDALRRSMLWTRKYFEHPAHWAGFSLIGDYR
ncbi:MAG: CHAT domain-containing protein [Myxococcota bacterium]